MQLHGQPGTYNHQRDTVRCPADVDDGRPIVVSVTWEAIMDALQLRDAGPERAVEGFEELRPQIERAALRKWAAGDLENDGFTIAIRTLDLN